MDIPSAARASPAIPSAAGASPAIAQWFQLKADHPDALLFLRMGDFYELFFADAEAAASALDIALTRRGEHAGTPIPMCGVPVHAAEAYLSRLIRRGFRVAVAEQMEPAKGRTGKGPLQRAVVRLVTPGTLTEDSLLDAHRPNLLLALASVAGAFGAAWLDVSTGLFETEAFAATDLQALLGRLEPAEILAAADLPLSDWSDRRGPATLALAPAAAHRCVAEAFGAASLDAFGAFTDAETVAAAMAIDYVRTTQAGGMPRLSRPQPAGLAVQMMLDAATRASLEITRARDGSAAHTLVAAVGRTLTAPGARMLAGWLGGPLLDCAAIARRQDGWAWMLLQPQALADLRAALRATPDVVRALGRLSVGRAAPRDLASVVQTLAAAQAASLALARAPMDIAALDVDPALLDLLSRALADTLPARLDDGGAIAPGFDGELDAERRLRDDSRRVIAGLTLDYAQRYGVASLKIRHHAQLGYVIEAPAVAVERLQAHPELTLRQGMANGARFGNTELADLDRRISEAADRAAARERLVFATLGPGRAGAVGRAGRLRQNAGAARRAAVLRPPGRGWALVPPGGHGRRPVLHPGRPPPRSGACAAGHRRLHAERLRPVRSAARAATHGAEHGGQEHLSPAERAYCDHGTGRAAGLGRERPDRRRRPAVQPGRRGGRPGARPQHLHGRDDGDCGHPAPGRPALPGDRGRDRPRHRHARRPGDRLGGAGGAARPEPLPNRVRDALPRAGQLAAQLPRLPPYTMRVKEWRGSVVFLHEVAEGAAGRSWGVHVAQLAGVPQTTVRRAAALLNALEKNRHNSPAELPLFAPAASEPVSLAPLPADPLRDALQQLEPDGLSPRDALETLYRIKALAAIPQGACGGNISIMSNPLPLPDRPEEAIELLDATLRASRPAGGRRPATQHSAASAATWAACSTMCRSGSRRAA